MIPTKNPNVVILSRHDDMFSTDPLGAFEFFESSSIVGLDVIHKNFGKGKIVELNERRDIITVEFECRKAMFHFPDAFASFLNFEEFKYQRGILKYMRLTAQARKRKHEARLGRSNLEYDPVEDTREYMLIADELDRLIKEEVGEQRYLGYCFMYWSAKRRILKEKYGIEWKSPGELNPHVMFD